MLCCGARLVQAMQTLKMCSYSKKSPGIQCFGAWCYGVQVSQGMQALESCSPSLLHRDLKPTNIFVDGGGHARIGDFGLSRQLLVETRASLTGETGTYLYMAPEVMRWVGRVGCVVGCGREGCLQSSEVPPL